MTAYRGRGLHKAIVEELGDRIAGGEYQPFIPIDMNHLETELAVSRSAMREAIKVLNSKGMMDARPRRGTYSLPRSQWLLLDEDVIRWQFKHAPQSAMLHNLAEVRAIFEPSVARIAAIRRTQTDIVELNAAIEDMSIADSRHAVAAADIRFHKALAASTSNEMLVRIAALVNLVLHERDQRIPLDGADPTPSHQAVLDAVVSNNPRTAETAMRELLVVASDDELSASDMSEDTKDRCPKPQVFSFPGLYP